MGLRHSVKAPEIGVGRTPEFVLEEEGDLVSGPVELDFESVVELEVNEPVEAGSALMVVAVPLIVVMSGVIVATGAPFDTEIHGEGWPADTEPDVDRDEVVGAAMFRDQQGVNSIGLLVATDDQLLVPLAPP